MKQAGQKVLASNSTQSTLTRETEPLFYHVSPGSTGSRTLYHAACNAGLPSVHHKSFCISSNRGVNGVSPRVVEGVRAHVQVLRLYQIAYKCCSLWNKGIIMLDHNNNGGGKISMREEYKGSNVILDLCSMPLEVWVHNIQTHLSTVLQSGVVGLFDTPYPLMAPQVLDLASKLRKTPPIVAMTERDAASWARSRSRNHNLMICKKEFSYEGLGASEFDILGCVERAGVSHTDAKKQNKDMKLYFWDVFEYRSRFDEANSEFLEGLELQMDHHQRLYRPMADYTPNFFEPSIANATKVIMTDMKVAKDMQHLVVARAESRLPFKSVNSTQTTLLPKKRKSLTCRGAVQYDFANDTFEELYDHPKKCGWDGMEKRLQYLIT